MPVRKKTKTKASQTPRDARTAAAQDDPGAPVRRAVPGGISGSRKTEEVESWQRFQGMIEMLCDWVWEVDTEGHYIYVSPRVKAVLGYEPEDILGKTPFELMPAAEARRVAGIFGPLVLQQKPVLALENICLHKDGHPVVLETSGLPFYDAGGNLAGYRGTDRDITDKKKNARGLEKVNSVLLSLGPDPGRNLAALAELAGGLLGADCAMYSRLEGEAFEVRALWGDCLKNSEFKAKGTPCFKVLRDPKAGRGLVFNDLSSFTNAECLGNRGFKSYFGHPVKFDGGKGVICVLYKKPYEPEEEDRRLFGIIASAIGMEESRSAGATALRESEKLYRSLFENMLNGFAYCRMLFENGEPRDFVYLSVNTAFEAQTGLKNVTGRRVSEVIPGIREADPGLFEIYGRVALTGRPERFEMYVKALDMWFSITAYSPLREHFVAVFDVITERKRVETGIREAFEMQRMLNAMLKRSLSNVPLRDKLNDHLSALLAAPWLSVDSKGAVFLANPGGRELVLTAQQGLSPALSSICAKVPFGRCICGKAAATGQPVVSLSVGLEHHITYEGMTPHGHYCAPITAGGKVLGVLNLYLKEGDVLTESQEQFVKAAADVMAGNIIHSQVEDKFSQAQKMEAVGMLAGGVAHDFNNILTAVKCYAGFIQKDLSPADPKLADTQEILNSVERAITLTRRLLAFSRRQIMDPRVVDINQILGDMVNMLRRIIGENILLGTRLFSAPCVAKVDPGQLEQVIMNLVVNARDAMPDGGDLIVETEIINPPEEFFDTRPELPVGPLVCIKVRDSGCGMDAEVKSRLFEPFFTTKEQGKGTGLGLPMVFGIVKQSGGEIEVESEPGKGSVFTVYLPFEEAQLVGEDKHKDRDKDTPAKGTETVLFVEDEESLRRLGGRVLLAGGYTALVASDGQAALKLMEERGEPVDLLITDVVMPGMSGRELALELARRKLVGRVLYMSGYTDEAIVKHGVLEPGIAFIYKPFTVDAVLSKMREVLDGPADQAKA